MDNEKLRAALLEQIEVSKMLVAQLAKLSAAQFAHERLIAATIAELALLTPEPDEFLERFMSDSEDTALHVLGQTNVATPLRRTLSEDEDEQRLKVLRLAQQMLRLLKALRGDPPPPQNPSR